MRPQVGVEVLSQVLRHRIPVRLRVTVRGRCMLPVVGDGDVVTAVPPDKLSFGDVVLFGESALVAHRVVGLGRHWVLTKGDRSLDFDRPLSRDQVLAKVVSIDRSGRTLELAGGWRAIDYSLGVYSLISGLILGRLSRFGRAKLLAHRAMNLPLVVLGRLTGRS